MNRFDVGWLCTDESWQVLYVGTNLYFFLTIINMNTSYVFFQRITNGEI